MKTQTQPRTPGTVSVRATEGVTVSYTRQFNLIEVNEGKKVVYAAIAPDKYTVREFAAYIERVKIVYEQN